MPASTEGLVNSAINSFASGVPGALSTGNLQGVLGSQCALGREFVSEVASASASSNGACPGTSRGDFGDAAEAPGAVDGYLLSGQRAAPGFAHARRPGAADRAHAIGTRPHRAAGAMQRAR
jgi:hypothetical protein